MGDVLAIEVTREAVRCLRASGFGPARRVRSYTARPLPPGLVLPSAGAPNIQDEAAFGRLLAEAIGRRPPRWARLVVPDRTARLHVLEGEGDPPPGDDLRRFLAWRLQDTLPFDSREARVACMAAPHGGGQRPAAVMLVAREQVLAQYERIAAGLGVGIAHIAPVACHLFNLAEAAADGSRGTSGFLALGPETATVILGQGDVPRYTRAFPRPIKAPDDGAAQARAGTGAATAVKELVRELAQTLAHAEDAAGIAPPARFELAGEMARHPTVPGTIHDELGIPCTLVGRPAALRGEVALPPEADALLAAVLLRL